LTCGNADPIVLDAGTGLRQWGDTLDHAETFRATALVTHLHLDHVQGLPFFTPLFTAGARFDIYGPPQEVGSFEKAMTRIFRPPLHPIRATEVQGEIRFFEVRHDEFMIGDARVTVRPVPHIGPTVGYRIEYGGVTVTYISDHQAPNDLRTIDDSVLELVSGADLLIHDAQYTPADWAFKSDWGHSTVGYAHRVATVGGARKLALYHHDPRRDDDAIDCIVAELQANAATDSRCEVIAAREGLILELTSQRQSNSR
jgi:ribonuclease BN (tRNA processing enzyme)